MKNETLYLHLKREYWELVKKQKKILEFRPYNMYWRSRLDHAQYKYVELCLGYPKKDDKNKRIKRGFIASWEIKFQDLKYFEFTQEDKQSIRFIKKQFSKIKYFYVIKFSHYEYK